MKKILIATTCIASLAAFTTAGAFAQGTGPAGQDTPSKTDTMSKEKTGGMMKRSGSTTGMNNGSMNRNSMSRSGMKNGAESKDGDGMPKGNMTR